MTAGGEILVVSGEPLWPATDGGRLRTAAMVAELARHLPVRVVAPVEGEPELDVPLEPLPPRHPPTGVALAASREPRLGRLLLDARRLDALGRAIARRHPRAVLFPQSYLAAVVPDVGAPTIVDFSDVEVRRTASLSREGPMRARTAYLLEAAKARRWEPLVARSATVRTTASARDAALLESWGAPALFVPHGSDAGLAGPSPGDGPVTFIASFGYAPNRQAARFLLRHVWPPLRREEPGLRLRLVGRDAGRVLGRVAAGAGVEVVGDPGSTAPYYAQASVILAPVRSGGGAQVKVTEALARGRVVVATAFSADPVPARARRHLVVADGAGPFAEAVRRLWRDREGRRRRERALAADRPVRSWEETWAPLVEAVSDAVSSR